MSSKQFASVVISAIFLILVGCEKDDNSIGLSNNNTNDFFNDQSDYPAKIIQSGITYELFVNQYETKDTVSVGLSLPANYEITNNSSKKLILEFKKSPRIQFTIRSSNGTLVVKEPQETVDDNAIVTIDTSTSTTFGIFRTLVDDNRKQIPPGSYKLRIKLNMSDSPILMKTFVIK
ncbi:MAG TPA: hypothetical protein VNJ29_00370 [Candidatus Nitrosotenuis sp.]|nr:hypothetical protein [Candidatus Nitrosotenuis sp.]